LQGDNKRKGAHDSTLPIQRERVFIHLPSKLMITNEAKYNDLRRQIAQLMDDKQRALELGNKVVPKAIDDNFKNLWQQAQSIYPRVQKERESKKDNTITAIKKWAQDIFR
jgi:hypothetical protein